MKLDSAALGRMLTIQRVGRIVGTLLAATMCAAAALMAVLAIYGLLSPAGMRARANAQLELHSQIANENRVFCQGFGMPPATPEHNRCVMELNKIRANQERRLADAASFF